MSDQFWQVFAPALCASLPSILTSIGSLIIVIRGRRGQRARVAKIETQVGELVETARGGTWTDGGADTADDRPGRRRPGGK